MNLLNDKPDDGLSGDLCASRRANSWWLDVGDATIPEITRAPRFDQWWTAILFGKEESAAAVDSDHQTVSAQAESCRAAGDRALSHEAAGSCELAFGTLVSSVDTSTLFQKIYANRGKAGGHHRLHELQENNL